MPESLPRIWAARILSPYGDGGMEKTETEDTGNEASDSRDRAPRLGLGLCLARGPHGHRPHGPRLPPARGDASPDGGVRQAGPLALVYFRATRSSNACWRAGPGSGSS